MKQGTKGNLYIALAAVVVVAALALFLRPGGGDSPAVSEPAAPTVLEMDHGVVLTNVGRYSGAFVEDGSDTPVADVLAITVENRGETDIQLGRVTLTAKDGQTYTFDFTTLPAGESLSVLESGRKTWQEGLEIVSAALDHVALFARPLSLCPEVYELSLADGSITVRNVSGRAVSGGRVFYKSIAAGELVGGITYMTTVPALEAGAETTLNAGHFSLSGSRLMFVTYAE